MAGRGPDWSGSGLRDVEGSFECGNEPSGFIKCGEYRIVAVELAAVKVWELKDDVFVSLFVCYWRLCMSGGSDQAGRNSGHSGDGSGEGKVHPRTGHEDPEGGVEV